MIIGNCSYCPAEGVWVLIIGRLLHICKGCHQEKWPATPLPRTGISTVVKR